MIKKLIYILIFIIASANFTVAQPQNAHLEYNRSGCSFKNFNLNNVLKTADKDMLLAQKSKTRDDVKKHLNNAMKNYYIATQIDSSSIAGHIGLGRVYDLMNLDKLAKENFFNALNIDPNNARANFYFGDFYFKREDYINALFHYNAARKGGLSKNYVLNYRLGVIYEKLANIETAKIFYINAMKFQPKNNELYEKIRLLDDLNYGDSQYYLFKKIK